MKNRELEIGDKIIVMPKYFDEWFERRSSSSRGDLVMMLTYEYFEDYLDDKFRDYYRKNKEKCYRAILDGYEVEKEPIKLYTVDCGGGVGLLRSHNNSVFLCQVYAHSKLKDRKLTQEEIENSEHSVLMAIAKEVE